MKIQLYKVKAASSQLHNIWKSKQYGLKTKSGGYGSDYARAALPAVGLL